MCQISQLFSDCDNLEMGRREQQAIKTTPLGAQGIETEGEGDGYPSAFYLAWGLGNGFVIRLLGTHRNKWCPSHPLKPRRVTN